MERAQVDQEIEARRLREVLKGRLNQEQALRVLHEFGNPEAALDFVLTGNPSDVRHYLHSDPSYVQELEEEAVSLAEDLNRGVENQIRQFACRDCLRSWWRRVPARKKVSKCRRCHQKYECIPRDREWGTGVYICDCGNDFKGFAVMQETKKVCHICRSFVMADHILPPKKGEKIEKRPNPFRFEIIGRQIRYASKKHISTGSTVSTYLTGGSYETASVSECPPLLDIPELRDEEASSQGSEH
ncbi:repressor of yield of denv protein homolog [Plakobranchus ocellatus]|uniref:Repressor of yield of denv protein homolog n=1 Tax=Plakobranchus ocellatus TaxID=259542 RepID=A0AAV4DCU5_9GAST|nr:repressor of yield of denv protein homolog [Plakobranchus ocellatus]